MVTRRTLHRLQFQSRGKFDIWVQQVSGGDPVRITKGPGYNWRPIGRPMASTLRIVPKTTRAACSLYLRLAVKGWPEKSRLSGTTLAGPPTARRYCSRTIFLLHILRTGSTWLVLTEAHRVRCLPISFHIKTSERFQPRGIPTARESPCGGRTLFFAQRHSEAFGRYRLRAVSQSDQRLPLKF